MFLFANFEQIGQSSGGLLDFDEVFGAVHKIIWLGIVCFHGLFCARCVWVWSFHVLRSFLWRREMVFSAVVCCDPVGDLRE